MEHILISSCLIGLMTRFNGDTAYEPLVKKLEKRYTLIPVCPELLGDLPIPREPATIENKDGRGVWEENISLVVKSGKNVTSYFKDGAILTLAFARFLKVKKIILKDGSPSCGVYYTDSSFKRIKGIGVTAYLLEKNGFKIYTIKSFLNFFLDFF